MCTSHGFTAENNVMGTMENHRQTPLQDDGDYDGDDDGVHQPTALRDGNDND